MSYISITEGTVHIVRFGMTNGEKGLSSMTFWRNGVGFIIFTDQAEIKGTAFEKPWLELVTMKTDSGNWQKRWHDLCDLILTQSLPILRELAPERRHWITLADYLNTPHYKLNMATDEGTGDALPTITEGPDVKPAYELRPRESSAFGDEIPSDVPHLKPSDLTVLSKEKNWRHPPYHVRRSDGAEARLFSCHRPTRHQGSDELSYPGHDKILFYLRLHKAHPRPDIRVPQLEAIVDGEGDGDGGSAEDAKTINGIIVTWADTVEVLDMDQDRLTADSVARWKAQALETVRQLHALRFTRLSVGCFDLDVDARGDLWLWSFHSARLAPPGAEPDHEGIQKDLAAVDFVFDRWLRAEVDVVDDPDLSAEERRRARVRRCFAARDEQKKLDEGQAEGAAV